MVGLRFTEEPTTAVYEFLRMSEEEMDEVFYTDDDIGNMRHHAFMIDVGLEEEDWDTPDVEPTPWNKDIDLQKIKNFDSNMMKIRQERKKQIADMKASGKLPSARVQPIYKYLEEEDDDDEDNVDDEPLDQSLQSQATFPDVSKSTSDDAEPSEPETKPSVTVEEPVQKVEPDEDIVDEEPLDQSLQSEATIPDVIKSTSDDAEPSEPETKPVKVEEPVKKVEPVVAKVEPPAKKSKVGDLTEKSIPATATNSNEDQSSEIWWMDAEKSTRERVVFDNKIMKGRYGDQPDKKKAQQQEQPEAVVEEEEEEEQVSKVVEEEPQPKPKKVETPVVLKPKPEEPSDDLWFLNAEKSVRKDRLSIRHIKAEEDDSIASMPMDEIEMDEEPPTVDEQAEEAKQAVEAKEEPEPEPEPVKPKEAEKDQTSEIWWMDAEKSRREKVVFDTKLSGRYGDQPGRRKSKAKGEAVEEETSEAVDEEEPTQEQSKAADHAEPETTAAAEKQSKPQIDDYIKKSAASLQSATTETESTESMNDSLTISMASSKPTTSPSLHKDVSPKENDLERSPPVSPFVPAKKSTSSMFGSMKAKSKQAGSSMFAALVSPRVAARGKKATVNSRHSIAATGLSQTVHIDAEGFTKPALQKSHSSSGLERIAQELIQKVHSGTDLENMEPPDDSSHKKVERKLMRTNSGSIAKKRKPRKGRKRLDNEEAEPNKPESQTNGDNVPPSPKPRKPIKKGISASQHATTKESWDALSSPPKSPKRVSSTKGISASEHISTKESRDALAPPIKAPKRVSSKKGISASEHATAKESWDALASPTKAPKRTSSKGRKSLISQSEHTTTKQAWDSIGSPTKSPKQRASRIKKKEGLESASDHITVKSKQSWNEIGSPTGKSPKRASRIRKKGSLEAASEHVTATQQSWDALASPTKSPKRQSSKKGSLMSASDHITTRQSSKSPKRELRPLKVEGDGPEGLDAGSEDSDTAVRRKTRSGSRSGKRSSSVGKPKKQRSSSVGKKPTETPDQKPTRRKVKNQEISKQEEELDNSWSQMSIDITKDDVKSVQSDLQGSERLYNSRECSPNGEILRSRSPKPGARRDAPTSKVSANKSTDDENEDKTERNNANLSKYDGTSEEPSTPREPSLHTTDVAKEDDNEQSKPMDSSWGQLTAELPDAPLVDDEDLPADLESSLSDIDGDLTNNDEGDDDDEASVEEVKPPPKRSNSERRFASSREEDDDDGGVKKVKSERRLSLFSSPRSFSSPKKLTKRLSKSLTNVIKNGLDASIHRQARKSRAGKKKPVTGGFSFIDLPTDVKQKVAFFLPVADVLNLVATTKSMRSDLNLGIISCPLTDAASQNKTFLTGLRTRCIGVVVPNPDAMLHSMRFTCDVRVGPQPFGRVWIAEEDIPANRKPKELERIPFHVNKVVARSPSLDREIDSIDVSFSIRPGKIYQVFVRCRMELHMDNMTLHRVGFPAEESDFISYQFDAHS